LVGSRSAPPRIRSNVATRSPRTPRSPATRSRGTTRAEPSGRRWSAQRGPVAPASAASRGPARPGPASTDAVPRVVLFALAVPSVGAVTSRPRHVWTMPTIGCIASRGSARRSKPPEFRDA
jgi:hypothetical protein